MEGQMSLPAFRLTTVEAAIIDELAVSLGLRRWRAQRHPCGYLLRHYTQRPLGGASRSGGSARTALADHEHAQEHASDQVAVLLDGQPSAFPAEPAHEVMDTSSGSPGSTSSSTASTASERSETSQRPRGHPRGSHARRITWFADEETPLLTACPRCRVALSH